MKCLKTKTIFHHPFSAVGKPVTCIKMCHIKQDDMLLFDCFKSDQIKIYNSLVTLKILFEIF